MFSSEAWLANPGANFYNGVATQSLRFDDGSSAYLSRTPSSAGNRRTFTWSSWVKRGNLGSDQVLLMAGADVNNQFRLVSEFSDAKFKVYYYVSGNKFVTPSAVFRDVSAWYHVVFAIDTTQSTASNRIKIYINGEQITDLETENQPTQNFETQINNDTLHAIGRRSYASDQYFDGYLSEVNLVDGLALDASYFGETKNGVWIAKEYTGSYGTNGFRLQFNQTGVGTASTSTIGADTSGNNNHWTSSGIVASDCNMPDSPENNFCTMNDINASSNVTMSNGNLTTVTSSAIEAVVATLGVSSGKWYWEVHINANATESFLGITTPRHNNDGASFYDSNQLLFRDDNGSVYYSTLTSRSLPAFEINDIVKIKLDLDNQTMEYSINDGSYVGSITLTDFNSHVAGETWLPTTKAGASGGSGSFNHTYNFGQDSSFAGTKTAQGNTDANGIGDFYYAPPTGYKALCTANLPEPTIGPNSATQADDYFNTVLFTGNGGTKSVTGLGFQPDLFWGKSRTNPSGVYSHSVYDSSRGVTKRLLPDLLNAESTTSGITSFDADGFTLGSNAGNNNNNSTYVNWCWKANGGTTSSNSDGSITSTVQANTTAGFSIVQYVATGSNATVGHGLGVEPDTVWVKNRDTDSRHWMSYWRPLGGTDRMIFNTGATASTSTSFNNTSPTSTVFSIGTSAHVNDTSDNYIAYCFASVEGYSKIGSYTGNGNADGTFVYTGFRPAFIIYKKTSGTGNWGMLDNTRSTSNLTQAWVASNLANAETNESTRALDFLSNGFKARGTNADLNTNSATYIYMAFAENPFKYANAR